ncbi:uncharacterized protein DUF4280 [Aneurinibacillus soli]|uniref:Type VII secretion system protein EssD-like domain-containing protein n=1 Tax=Aneurinibacillus soli TaxID=1500254 RepID=A0A0U5AYY3_9BACL|nr:PAAR-like protein [Aneurinibacillus soli]PYE60384.1 uncharacterized protein DUF4280 [Aneurinibacillus soli]BAU27216.1 hypothetical protein CB4_01385 [Aneurinibacillus soli]
MYINILQNGEEEKSYVVAGAVLCCTMGSTPSQFQLPCSYGLYIKGKPQMSIMDYQPHVNVLPFGICAKGMPCSPSLFMPWINGISNKSVGDFPSLSNQSITLCASGGIIQIQEDGQGGSDVLTGSRKVENNLGFFEQLAKMGNEMKIGVNRALDEIGPATRHVGTELITPKNYIPLTRELVGPERFDTIMDSSKPKSERANAIFGIIAGIAENAGPGKIGKAGKQISKVGKIAQGTSDLGISKITKDSPGQIIFGELDHLGRPTGVTATITKDMIGTGSKASQSIKPPGFLGGGPGSPGHARGHLLGNQLGGTGKDTRNLVTLYQNPVNSPVMRDFESSVRAAVEKGGVVRYQSIPVYEGNNLVPTGVTLKARGTDGFSLDVTIINRK